MQFDLTVPLQVMSPRLLLLLLLLLMLLLVVIRPMVMLIIADDSAYSLKLEGLISLKNRDAHTAEFKRYSLYSFDPQLPASATVLRVFFCRGLKL